MKNKTSIRNKLGRAGVMLGLGLFTFLCAAFIALAGASKVTLLMLAAIAGLSLLAVSTSLLVQLTAFTVFLVIGQLMYFAGINQALWLAYGLGALLYLRVPIAYLSSPLASTRLGLPFLFPLAFFFLVVGVSTAANTPPFLQVVVGGKNLVMLWSLFLVLAMGAVAMSSLERGFRLLFGLAWLQVPFVLYQFLVVAPKRSDLGGRFGVSWDSIVGTYGGDPMGGGFSGTMAYMLILTMVLAIALRKYQLIRLRAVIGVWLASLFAIGVAEIKVVVVLLPIGIAVLFWRDILRMPLKALLGGLGTLALLLGILLLYNQIHVGDPHRRAHDLTELMDQTFGYSLDSQLISASGEMGRTTAIVFWYHEGFQHDPLRGMIGYGPGASRSSSSLIVGEVARKYKFGIDRSTMTQLLWDLGLVGFLAYAFIFGSAALMALRLAPGYESASSRATLEACGAGLVMVLVMLPYDRDLLETPSLAFTVMAMLGYVAQAQVRRQLAQRREFHEAPAAAGARYAHLN